MLYRKGRTMWLTREGSHTIITHTHTYYCLIYIKPPLVTIKKILKRIRSSSPIHKRGDEEEEEKESRNKRAKAVLVISAMESYTSAEKLRGFQLEGNFPGHNSRGARQIVLHQTPRMRMNSLGVLCVRLSLSLCVYRSHHPISSLSLSLLPSM